MSAPSSRARRRHRRGHGGVHPEDGPGRVCGPRGRAHVDHVPGRIHRGLDPHYGGVARTEHLFEGTGYGRIEEGHVDAATRGETAQPVRAAVVHDPRCDDALAPVQRFEEGGDPGHSGAEEERVVGPFEPRQELFDVADGGVGGPAVDEAPRLVAFVAPERRGGMDRRDDRAGFGIDEVAALSEQGVSGEVVLRHARNRLASWEDAGHMRCARPRKPGRAPFAWRGRERRRLSRAVPRRGPPKRRPRRRG